MFYLAKTEPEVFGYADLVRAKREPWDGVTNPTAQMHMRAVSKGDLVFIYHTGSERRVAGLARVVKGAYPDPEKPALLKSGEPKFVLFDCAPVAEATGSFTLADAKADVRFAGFELVTQSRLSVMPVPDGLAGVICGAAGLPRG